MNIRSFICCCFSAAWFSIGFTCIQAIGFTEKNSPSNNRWITAHNHQISEQHCRHHDKLIQIIPHSIISISRGGASIIPGGYHPLGYRLTELGEEFLKYNGSSESDVGRVLSSLKPSGLRSSFLSSNRKTFATLKAQWLEVVKQSKTGQSMRIYKTLQEIIDFCVKTGLVD